MVDKDFKWTKKYYVWCAGCGHEKMYRQRLQQCPNCGSDLQEKTWLM